MLTALRVFALFLALFGWIPISFYLQYSVFKMVGATDIMWLLFWAQIPIIVILQCVNKLAEALADD